MITILADNAVEIKGEDIEHLRQLLKQFQADDDGWGINE